MGQVESGEYRANEILHAPGLEPFTAKSCAHLSIAVPSDRPLKIEVLAIHGWRAWNSENKEKSAIYAKKTAECISKQLHAQNITDFELGTSALSGCRANFAMPCRDGDTARSNKQTIAHRVRACMEELLELGKLTTLTHSDVVFVTGHSQGGLVGAGLLHKLYSYRFLREKQTVFLHTIATPHHGVSEAWTQYGREATVELRELATENSAVSLAHANHMKSCLDNGTVVICVGSYQERIVGLASSMADGFHHPNIYRALWVPPHQAVQGEVTHQDSYMRYQYDAVALQIALLAIARRNLGYDDDILRFITPGHDVTNDIAASLAEIVNTGKIIFSNPKYLPPMLPHTKRTILDVRAHTKIHQSELVYNFATNVFMHTLAQQNGHESSHTNGNGHQTRPHNPAEWRHPRFPSNDDWCRLATLLTGLSDADERAKAVLAHLRGMSEGASYQNTIGSFIHPLVQAFAVNNAAAVTPKPVVYVDPSPHMMNNYALHTTKENVHTTKPDEQHKNGEVPFRVEDTSKWGESYATQLKQDEMLEVVRSGVLQVMPDAKKFGDKLDQLIITNKFNLNSIIDQLLDMLGEDDV